MLVTVRYQIGEDEAIEVMADHDFDGWAPDVLDDMLTRASQAASDVYVRMIAASRAAQAIAESEE